MDEYEEELPIGIDLGTTNSCIGCWRNNEVIIIPNTIGESTTPSIVAFHEKSSFVGEQTEKFPFDGNKIHSIKRIIGRNFNEPKLKEDIKKLNYKVVQEKNGVNPFVQIKDENGNENLFSPIEISSMILKKLVNDAKQFLNRKIKKVVITIPAHFNDSQRDLTIEAAKSIDLDVLRIINEPTAAALSYGMGQKNCPLKDKIISNFADIIRRSQMGEEEEFQNENNDDDNYCLFSSNNNNKNILVFDLGGGTFDLTILNIIEGNLSVLSTDGDIHLGGEDFDDHLVNYCLTNFCSKRNLKIDLVREKYKESIARLKITCEHNKRLLSIEKETTIKVNNFIDDYDLIENITKEQFQSSICGDLFDRIEEYFGKILKKAKLNEKDINEIILVGGSSRMPKITEIIKSKFPSSKINNKINPDEIVAYGATIQAAIILSEGRNNILSDIKLKDITPLTLGTDVKNTSKIPEIKEKGNIMSVIIPRGQSIPTSKTKLYKTTEDNQDSMLICVFEGESFYVNENIFLGAFELKNISKRPKGETEVNVTFNVDINNLLTVTAVENAKGSEPKSIEIINDKQKGKENNKINGNYQMKKGKINKTEINYKQKIIEYSKEFTKTKNEKEKFKILQNYNESVLYLISLFDFKDPKSFENESKLEKYYYYILQLFQSYVEMIKLKNKVEEVKNIEKNLLEDIKNNLEIFKNKNFYYIRNITILFKDTIEFSDIFYKIIIHEIKIYNEIGEDYLNNKRKFSRFYAKLYFSEASKLFNEYIKPKKAILSFNEIIRIVETENKKTEQRLTEINSNAIVVINMSRKNKELFSQEKLIQICGTGFTLMNQKLQLTLENTIDEYNIALVEYEKILSEIESSSRDINSLDDNIKEEKAICLGSIVKINFLFLKRKDYKKYKRMLETCKVIGEELDNDCREYSWYLEAEKLEKKIDEILLQEKKEEEKKWEEKWKPKLEEEIKKLQNLFQKKDKMEFINYIIKNHQFKNYDKDSRINNFNRTQLNRDYINYLVEKYHPDQYSKSTLEERYHYSIFSFISEKINSLQQNF